MMGVVNNILKNGRPIKVLVDETLNQRNEMKELKNYLKRGE